MHGTTVYLLKTGTNWQKKDTQYIKGGKHALSLLWQEASSFRTKRFIRIAQWTAILESTAYRGIKVESDTGE